MGKLQKYVSIKLHLFSPKSNTLFIRTILDHKNTRLIFTIRTRGSFLLKI